MPARATIIQYNTDGCFVASSHSVSQFVDKSSAVVLLLLQEYIIRFQQSEQSVAISIVV